MNTTKELAISDATEAFAVPGAGNIIDCIHPITGLSWIYGNTLEQIRTRYPGAERVNIAEWMSAKAAAQDSPITWTEVSEETFWEMLEVLPPACMIAGNFLVGEPCDHHAGNGQPRFQAYIKRDGKYLAANRPMTRTEFKALFKPEFAAAA